MLVIEKLNKSFFHRPVLKNLSIRINAGEIVGLLGKNGVGKSTFLRIVAGLSTADGGNIYFKDKPVRSGNSSARQEMLYIGHAPGLYPSLTAVENLTLAANIYNVTNEQFEIRGILDSVGLVTQQDEPIKNFSQGMLQRLKLALTRIIPWSLLLFDEPFSGLDWQGRDFTNKTIRQWRSDNRTVMLVLHDLDWALSFCSRIMLLEKGSIVFDSLPGETDHEHIWQQYQKVMA